MPDGSTPAETSTRPDEQSAPSVADEPPAGSGIRTWWWREARPLLLRLHFYAGLFVGPFILVAAVTGLAYTVTPQLESVVHDAQLRVTVPPGATPLPLSAQVTAALAAFPTGTVTEIRPPAAPDGTTRVSFADPTLPEDWTRTVFIDPFTGQSRGTLVTYGEWLPVRAWFDELHRNLHLGALGRHYSELAASWLWVLVGSGLVMWLLHRRRAQRVRRTLLPEPGARGRTRLRSWHASVGVWAAVGLLFLSATGITWSRYAGDNVTALRAALNWETPSVSTELPAGTPGPSTDLAHTAERVWSAARSVGLTDPVAITPAGGPGEAWVVAQVKRSWPERQDSVAVDPASGAVLEELRFADWPLAAKLARWGVDAHMGLLFGWPNQIALGALAFGVIGIVAWGYRMWWLRRPGLLRTSSARPGLGWPAATGVRPPGTDRAPSFRTLVLFGLLAIVVGVFLPMLGGSLVAFLLVDAVLTQRFLGGERAEVPPVG